MSSSQFQSSSWLYRRLKLFKNLISITKDGAENFDAMEPGSDSHDSIVFQAKLLGAYRDHVLALVETTEKVADHEIHPDLSQMVSTLVDDIKDTLRAITMAIYLNENGSTALRDELEDENKEEELWKKVQEFGPYQKLLEVWRDALFDLPCLHRENYELPPNPFEADDVTTLEDYEYEPLPTQSSIRVVEMHREFEKDDDILSLLMQTVDLDDKPSYSTLSYTWAKPSIVFPSAEARDELYNTRVPILLNGKLFYIGQNLHRYLRQWRRNLRTENEGEVVIIDPERCGIMISPGALWIDSMCINQSNDQEKNKQVAMMGRIYQSCEKVHVWLGAWDCYSGPAHRVIMRMYEHNVGKEDVYDDWYDDEPEDSSLTVEEKLQKRDLPPKRSWAWICLWAFFNRTWFRRAWVVQELALAPDVQIEFGHAVMTWGLVLQIIFFLRRSGLDKMIEEAVEIETNGPGWRLSHIDDDDDDEQLVAKETVLQDKDKKAWYAKEYSMAQMSLFPGLLDVARNPKDREDGNWSPMVNLFSASRHFYCLNPRDKIYAFLSLVSREYYQSSDTDPRRKPIIPRYQDPVEEIYTEAAWYILLSGNNLQLLDDADTWEDRQPIPTADANEDTADIDNLNLHNLKLQDKAKGEDNANTPHLNLPSWVPDWSHRPSAGIGLQEWAATPSISWGASNHLPWTPPSNSSLLYQPTLPITGHFVDRITSVAASSGELLDAVEVALGLPPLYPHTPGLQSPIEVLWRTYLFDKTESLECPAPASYGEQFEFYLLRSFSGFPCSHCVSQNHRCPIPDEPDDELLQSRVTKAHKRFTPYISPSSEKLTCVDRDTAKIVELRKRMFGGRWNHSVWKVFRTEGEYFGIGMEGVREGDEVWVVAGSAVPFVLRRMGDGEFALVSQAYVHGIMFGEVFTKSGGAEVEMKDIRLV